MSTKYQYIECGLDNVFISGLEFTDDMGEQCIMIPAINQLHKLIASALLVQEKRLSSEEIYFLRAEMGSSEEEIKGKLGVNTDKALFEVFKKSFDIEKAFRQMASGILQVSASQMDELKRVLNSKDIQIQAPSRSSQSYSIAA